MTQTLLTVRPTITNPEPTTPGLAFEDMWPKEDFYGNGHSYERMMVPEGWAKLKRWERFMSKKYVDTTIHNPDGTTTEVWAICYGHSGHSGVWPSQQEIIDNNYEFTQEEAWDILQKDMHAEYIPQLSRLIKVNVTSYMFSGLLLIFFNMGETKFKKTAILPILHTGKYLAACTAFLVLPDGTTTNNKAGNVSGVLVMQNGLSCRRADEMSLYLTRIDR